MTNTNLKELKKRFEANVLDGDSIYDCGNAIFSVDIVWDFIESAVLDERKRIVEEIEDMPEFADGTMGDVISKNDILQKIKEMK